jgi:hypothetical protein
LSFWVLTVNPDATRWFGNGATDKDE